jgi:hypothetical protein
VRKLKKNVWPYQSVLNLEIDDQQDKEMVKWCNETIGLRFRDWYSYSFNRNRRIYAFKDEATLLVFKIKWGQHGTKARI